MFNYYGGVPEIIYPDNTKTAVIKANKYDPDLNEDYNHFTNHYVITVVPVRINSPKDKAFSEGAVKLIQRYFHSYSGIFFYFLWCENSSISCTKCGN